MLESKSAYRPLAPKQQRSRASLQRLLETTAQMLIEQGYNDFTLKQVSKRSGVSIGSIYNLIENKQQLVREVQVRMVDSLERDHAKVMNDLRRKCLPLRELVPEAVRDYAGFLRSNAALLRVFMEIAEVDAVVAENGKNGYWRAVRDFELLVLDRREEIRHEGPERAVRASFTIMYSAIARYLGLGTSSDVTAEGDWDELLEDVSRMVLSFLVTAASDLRA